MEQVQMVPESPEVLPVSEVFWEGGRPIHHPARKTRRMSRGKTMLPVLLRIPRSLERTFLSEDMMVR
jgi:hypothetical protein